MLRSPMACRRVLGILDKCAKRYRVKLLGYVIMPEHIHVALWSKHAKDVQVCIRQFLRLAASEIASMVSSAAERGNMQAAGWLEQFRGRARQGVRVRVWKERGRAFPVTKEDGLRQKLDYMHQNPVRRNLVGHPEDWEFSSARWYAGGASLIDVDDFDW